MTTLLLLGKKHNWIHPEFTSYFKTELMKMAVLLIKHAQE